MSSCWLATSEHLCSVKVCSVEVLSGGVCVRDIFACFHYHFRYSSLCMGVVIDEMGVVSNMCASTGIQYWLNRMLSTSWNRSRMTHRSKTWLRATTLN